jgi:hypothetical protein
MYGLMLIAALVTDLGSTNRLLLYSFENTEVTERVCPAGTTWPSVLSCTAGKRAVDATAFFREAALVGPSDAASAAEAARQAHAMMEEVQQRISELHATDTDPTAAETLRQAIDLENRELTTREATARETSRQIALLDERIAGGDHDPELVTQLGIYAQQLLDDDRRVQDSRAKLVDLETRYVAQLRDDGAEFRDLVGWRGQLLDQWNAARSRYEHSLAARADAQRLVGYVRDGHDSLPTIVTAAATTFPTLKPWAAEMESVFERAAVATGTGDPKLWVRTLHRGSFTAADGHRFTILGFKPHENSAGDWLIEFTGHPDLESQCYAGVMATALDMEKVATKTEYAYCWRSAHKCVRSDVYVNQPVDRNFRLDIELNFTAPDAVKVDVSGSCAKFPGTTLYWQNEGLEVMDFVWR